MLFSPLKTVIFLSFPFSSTLLLEAGQLIFHSKYSSSEISPLLVVLSANTIHAEIHLPDHNQSTYQQGHEQAIRHYHYSEQPYHQKRCTCWDCGQAGTDEKYYGCPRQARKSLHNVIGAARGFGNKIDIVDIQNLGNFHESIFLGTR